MRFILRRLGFFLLTLWAALTLNFLIPRLMPGNPALAMMARFHGRVSGTVLAALEAEFGVDTKSSLWSQYWEYMRNTLTGHLGVSTTYFPQPVTDVIRTGLPWTVGLVGVTTVLSFVLGSAIGVIGGWRRGGKLDSIFTPVFIVTSSVPYFWVGLMGVLIFSVVLTWLPSDFAFDNTLVPEWSPEYVGNVLQHALLPAATILITSIGTWILTMRNNMVTVIAEDYVRMGRAKGLSSRRVMVDYAARNAMLPNLTGFAMSLGFVVSGAILVEYVFDYPGVGFMLLQASENEDYALMQGLFLLITVAVLLSILACDILTAILDPTDPDAGLTAMATTSTDPVAAAAAGANALAPRARRRVGAFANTWNAIRHNRKATVGAILLSVFTLMALFPGLLAPYDPEAEIFPPSTGPTAQNWLGTTHYGQDILSQVIWGARPSMVIAVGVGVLATVVSIMAGVTAAYLGGVSDSVISLVTDVFLVIPTFPLIIVIASYAKSSSDLVLILVLVITGWSYGARQLRVQALSLRRRDFLESARVRGERRSYIITVEILPTMTSLLVANFLGAALYAVLTAAGLQFIGLGDPAANSWGTMLYWAKQASALQTEQYMWAIVPGVCIALLGAAFALLNFAFDEISNPALRPVRRPSARKAARG